jgi:formylglycine-generating enzyme required for sulfatase activity
MVVAPSGSFTMGSPAGEPGRETSEGPQHQVAIAEPFAVGRFTVTRGEYETFVRETNHPMDKGCFTWVGSWKFDSGKDYHAPGFPQSDGHPVVCVNWEDAKAYAAWLSQKTGKNYRLLTEAEFEYVARAGTRTPFWWGTSLTADRANYHATMVYAGGGQPGDYRAGTVLAKTFAPNPWGLYQVHGNALEWVEDCWNDTYNGAPADGAANETGDCGKRGVRGGCWICYPQYLRSARRSGRASGARGNNFGIRVARSIAP